MRLFLSIVLLLAAHMANCQKEGWLSFVRINGLSQNTVYSLLRDKQDFLWIATANGLNRYDGVDMKSYKPLFGKTTGQMKGRIIRSALLEDDEDRIWFSTDMVVHSFNKRTRLFSQYKLFYAREKQQQAVELKANIETFANPLLKKGNYLWLASAGEGLYALNTKTGTCISYPVSLKETDGGKVAFMVNGVHDDNNRFWFASNQGLLSFDQDKKEWSCLLKGASFYTITRCADTLYLGNNDGISWFDLKTFTMGKAAVIEKPAHLQQGMIRCFYTDKQKNIWAGDQTGNIYYKSHDRNQFVWRGNINGNPPGQTLFPVYCLFADHAGNLWSGADVLGLSKAEITPVPFRKFPAAVVAGNTAKDLFIHSIYEEDEENVWVGTFQNGLLKLNTQTGIASPFQFSYFDPSLPYAQSVPLIKADSYGNLWTSHSGYLYIREKGKKNFSPVKMPSAAFILQSPQLWALTEYKAGWVLATNIGLYWIYKEKGEYSIHHLKEFLGTKITAVYTAPDKTIWVIPETGGIYIAAAIEELSKAKRMLPDENVKAVEFDSLHRLIWICTANGLFAYHPRSGQLNVYTEANGLLNSYVYGVLFHNDELWVSTNNGMAKGRMVFNKTTVFPEIRFLNFTESEGLPANEFNTGAFHRGHSGRFYFGTVKGVIWFRPEDVSITYPLPPLRLIDFRINEHDADSSMAPEYIHNIRLTYSRNNLYFRFRGIDYNHADKLRYVYQLEGWDKNWIYSGALNEVRYNNLPPGKYVFKVKVVNQSGAWSETPYEVFIDILPPFWKTWWFYSIIVMILITLLVLVTRYFAQQKLKQKVMELEKQKEIDKERLRISREMHDDIGAGLTQITLMSESAKTKHKAGELDEIAQTSRQLVNNMSEIIWSLNPENKTLENLLAYLREQLHKQLEYSGIRYAIQFPETGTNMALSNEQRRNILLVTKEIINNAVKYSQADNIVVKADIRNGTLDFEVKDDGVGFESSKWCSGNGLKNISHRIKELGGTLIIDTSLGKGSRFVYSIPLPTTT